MNSGPISLRLPQPEFIPGHFGVTLPLRKNHRRNNLGSTTNYSTGSLELKAISDHEIPSREPITSPLSKPALFESMIFLSPQWDMLVPRRVEVETLFFPTIVIRLKVGYWLIKKFSSNKKLPKSRSIS